MPIPYSVPMPIPFTLFRTYKSIFSTMSKPNVGVLVYGDIGRSPRMQNHALQLARDFHVYLIGYRENEPTTEITSHPDIELVDISSDFIKKLKAVKLFYLYALLRIIIQTLQLLWLLIFRLKGLKFVLVQNPPSIPVLSTVWVAARVRSFKMIVDFHNYGYTILKMGVKNKVVVGLAEKYEKFFGKRCDHAFCVSDNMRQNLEREWAIRAIPLYDRPSGRAVKFDRDQMLKKVGVERKPNDLVLVSSTSWTKDEDFGILLKALQRYESQADSAAPFLYVLITGKGPQKEHYLKLIADMEREGHCTKFKVLTLWLEADDYPRLLASCDLGVCLHYSSSGLDLPMKVVDMFGAGLPVLAIDFPTIHELVKDGQNGHIFQDCQDLFKKLSMLANSPDSLSALRLKARQQKSHTFDREWQQKFGPLCRQFL